MTILYLSLSGVLVYLCARRAMLISPPTVWSAYLFVSLLVYEWVVDTGLTLKQSVFSAMPLSTVSIPYHTVYLTFLALQTFALATTIGLPRPKNWMFFDTSIVLRYAHYICGSTALLGMAILWFLSAIHFASIDHDTLWLNFAYRTIKDPSGIGATGLFPRLYHFGFRFVGLAAVAAGVIYFHRRAWLHLILALGLICYAMLFLLADNSRWVPIYFACAAAMNFVVSKRALGALTWINLGLLFVTFAKVLSDRSKPAQGVSTIIAGFEDLRIGDVPIYIEGFFTNMFPAALNFANTVVIDGTHDFAYKIRAFSPFPGFIDNYQAIQDQFQIKLAPSVPMSAFGEVYSFGWPYAVLFFGVTFVWLRLVARLMIQKLDAPALILGIMSYYFVAKLGSYAVRQSWRMMIVVIFLAITLQLFRTAKRKKNSRPGRRAAPGLTPADLRYSHPGAPTSK